MHWKHSFGTLFDDAGYPRADLQHNPGIISPDQRWSWTLYGRDRKLLTGGYAAECDEAKRAAEAALADFDNRQS